MVAPAVAAPTSIITITATIAVASGIAAAVPVTSTVAIPATIAIPVAISIAALHDNLSIGRKVGLAAGFDLSGQHWGCCQGKGSPQ